MPCLFEVVGFDHTNQTTVGVLLNRSGRFGVGQQLVAGCRFGVAVDADQQERLPLPGGRESIPTMRSQIDVRRSLRR